MDDLIARVEALAAPDREVDELVRCAVFAPADAYVEQSPINGAWCIYEFGYSGKPRLWTPRNLSDHARTGSFTASIDAAMTLVPEGAYKSFGQVGNDPAWAVVCPSSAIDGDELDDEEMLHAAAATPALALCAAALRARAALHHKGSGE